MTIDNNRQDAHCTGCILFPWSQFILKRVSVSLAKKKKNKNKTKKHPENEKAKRKRWKRKGKSHKCHPFNRDVLSLVRRSSCVAYDEWCGIFIWRFSFSVLPASSLPHSLTDMSLISFLSLHSLVLTFPLLSTFLTSVQVPFSHSPPSNSALLANPLSLLISSPYVSNCFALLASLLSLVCLMIFLLSLFHRFPLAPRYPLLSGTKGNGEFWPSCEFGAQILAAQRSNSYLRSHLCYGQHFLIAQTHLHLQVRGK